MRELGGIGCSEGLDKVFNRESFGFVKLRSRASFLARKKSGTRFRALGCLIRSPRPNVSRFALYSPLHSRMLGLIREQNLWKMFGVCSAKIHPNANNPVRRACYDKRI